YGGLYVVAFAYLDNRIAPERNSISVDPWGGRIVAMNLSTSLTPRERLMAANEAIHTGSIFGMPTRILAALASFVLPLQVVSGLLIWIRRTILVRQG
ncbi:MAG TPA: PepSY-associated TM helix domain-containing protein, partial [Candidatus Udaeobacter sp.]|nr:PepSY-associated TM helix domain-containing protein [Candidatus Udaeobacter sp.]